MFTKFEMTRSHRSIILREYRDKDFKPSLSIKFKIR